MKDLTIDTLCARIKEWRIRQGFETPTSLEGTNNIDMQAKVSLFLEETGEAKTAVRKADLPNFIEEITDLMIRLLDVSSAMGHQPLSHPETFPYRQALPEEQWVSVAWFMTTDLWCGVFPPQDLASENGRRAMLISLVRIDEAIIDGAFSAAGAGQDKDFLFALDFLITVCMGMLWHVGKDWRATCNEKMTINEQRPPKNGKVSSI